MNEPRYDTYLGKLLVETRLIRGYANIKKYLRDFSLPVSYLHYHDIEAGKRQIGLETAGSLCNALQINTELFYFHLLKDILPADTFALLLSAGIIRSEASELAGKPRGADILMQEITATARQFVDRHIAQTRDPCLFHGIVILKPYSRQRIQALMVDLVSELSRPINTQDASPLYFYSFILSERSQYWNKTNNRNSSFVPEINTTDYLGNYLRSLRLERGFTNLSDYVRHCSLPISYAYYRELESGRRKPKLKTAQSLCCALKADTSLFYFHLLKDILPPELTEHFNYVMPVSQRMSGQEREREQERVSQKYRQGFLNVSQLNFTIMNESACRYFINNIEHLTLIWFIYSKTEVLMAELSLIARANGIDAPVEAIVRDFEQLGLIELFQSDTGGLGVRRLHVAITWRDRELQAKYLVWETEKTITQVNNTQTYDSCKPFIQYGYFLLAEDERRYVLGRIGDLLAELRSTGDDHLADDGNLYYFAMTLASRSPAEG